MKETAPSRRSALDSRSNGLTTYMTTYRFSHLEQHQLGKELTSEAKIGRKMVAVAVFEVTSVKVVIMTQTMITMA